MGSSQGLGQGDSCEPHLGLAKSVLGEPCPLSTETFGFFLPCIPCKALMRVHFTDNFMTLTISPCNRIFKMAPCLHSGG